MLQLAITVLVVLFLLQQLIKNFPTSGIFLKNLKFTFTISNDLAFGVFQFCVTHLAIATIILTSYVVIYRGLLLYIFKTLKKSALFGKEGDIFRPESKKIIQNLSGLFIFLAILGTHLVVVSIVIFIIILYESFFVGYHYKKENEKLSEENNLTI